MIRRQWRPAILERNPCSTRRRWSSDQNAITDVAVLGGGISGLVTAYCLTKRLPTAKVTLFESSERLGGWLNSRSVNVSTGSVVFEQGPRTLRPNAPNGLVTLALLQELGLAESILATDKQSPAARNRYVYYPDHLVRMPGPGAKLRENLRSLLHEPLLKGILPALCLEAWKPRRPSSLRDESVGSFVSRRFSPKLADNVVSALLHGIYAGDVYKLSVRSIFPSLWHMEETSGSVLRHALGQWIHPSVPPKVEPEHVLLDDAGGKSLDAARASAVYALKGGLAVLATALRRNLIASGVSLRMNAAISNISLKNTQIVLKGKQNTELFSHVIATMPSHKLADCLESREISTLLKMTPSVTVMVVNLFFENPQLLKFSGFGYLLPRSLPTEMNPERALGVIFDSDATIGQDDVPGTKMTVMIGGHWWDGMQQYPDEEQGAQMARAVVRRHLNVTEAPLRSLVSLQKDCIPQYTVGHHDRMAQIGQKIGKLYGGRLLVTGNSYTGVGLNDCVRNARDVVVGLSLAREKSGLDSFQT